MNTHVLLNLLNELRLLQIARLADKPVAPCII